MEKESPIRPAKKGPSVKEFLGRWERTWKRPMAKLYVPVSNTRRQAALRWAEVGKYMDEHGNVVARVIFDGERGAKRPFIIDNIYYSQSYRDLFEDFEGQSFGELDQVLMLIRGRLAERNFISY